MFCLHLEYKAVCASLLSKVKSHWSQVADGFCLGQNRGSGGCSVQGDSQACRQGAASADSWLSAPTYRDAQNLVEAASSGAAVSVKIVSNIAANLVAFLAVLAFVNATLNWLGHLVDVQGLSFEV